jgi:hypothetical protein
MLEALARAELGAAEGHGVPAIGRLPEVDDLGGGVVVGVTRQRRTDAACERDRFHRRKEYPQDIENTSQKVRHS